MSMDFGSWQKKALLCGLVGVTLSLLGAFADAAVFFRSYLLAYVYWISFALASLGLTLLHNLTGGRWGVVIRSFLNSGMSTLPLMALLVIPILVGIPTLYHWAHQDAVAHDAVLQHKAPYLNVTAFVVRTVFYFTLWIATAVLLRGPRAKWISGPALILFVFSVTFAAVDWIMSLEPHWYSTIYGAILIVGQALQTLALCVILLALLADKEPFVRFLHPLHFHDLGNLIFAFTVLWAYTAFSQFLIIWSGNLPEETPWYLRRTNEGWQMVTVILMLFHFAVPFFLLLMRYVKRRARLLARVAAGILIVRVIDLFYWIEPAHSSGLVVSWMHLTALVGIGGIWLYLFLRRLGQGPVLDVNDPRLPVLGHGGAH